MKGHIRKATVALAAASVLGFVGCSGSSAEPSPADPTETLQMSADYPVYNTLDEALNCFIPIPRRIVGMG